MRKTYTILGLIAAVVLAVYYFMPKYYFEEPVFPLPTGATVIAYDDIADGGESAVEFKMGEDALHFSCQLGADTSKAAWCGLLWNLDSASTHLYKNWTFVDTLVFDVEVHGTREVLVKLWTFDPDVTDIKKPRTFRLLMKELPLREGRQRVAIPVEHLYTPEFWYENAKASPELTQRHMEAAARLEIAPGWNQSRGSKFSVTFYSVTARGMSNIAFGIVLGIFLVLTIVAVGRRHKILNDEQKK